MDDRNVTLKDTLATDDESRHRPPTVTDANPQVKNEIVSTAQTTPTSQTMDKPPSLSDTCSGMKELSINEGQQLVAKNESLGKPQTFTQACSAMKEEIATEAEMLYPATPTGETPESGVSEAMKHELAERAEDEQQRSE
jgi:predicted lipid-binding transport protein (Tim44 family)